MAANRESRAANPAPSKTPASGNRSGTANGTDVFADAQGDEWVTVRAGPFTAEIPRAIDWALGQGYLVTRDWLKVERDDDGNVTDVGKAGEPGWNTVTNTEAHRDSVLLRASQKKEGDLWALRTGSVSGVTVLDFDDEAGMATLARSGLEPTLTTPGHGAHVLVATGGRVVGSAGYDAAGRYPGMEVKGDGKKATFFGTNPYEGGRRYGFTSWPPKVYRWDELNDDLRSYIESLPIQSAGEAGGGEPIGADAEWIERKLSEAIGEKVDHYGSRNQAGHWFMMRLWNQGVSKEDAWPWFEKFRELAEPLRPGAYGVDAITDTWNSVWRQSPDDRSPETVTTKRTDGANDIYTAVANEVQRLRIRQLARESIAREEWERSFKRPPSLGSLFDELQVDRPPLVQTIEDLHVQGGNTIVAAMYKTGKTTLMLNLLRSLVRGKRFLGVKAVEAAPGNVAFWNYELSDRQMLSWFFRLGLTEEEQRRISVWNLRGYSMPLLQELGEREAVDWLLQRDVGTLVIDPLFRAFRSAGGLDENSNGEIGRFLDKLDVIKERANVTDLFIPTHFGRAEERTRGATVIDDWCDGRWNFTKKDDARYLSAEGRDVSLEEDRVDFKPEGLWLSLTGTGGRKSGPVDLDRKLDAVVAYVAEHPWIKAGDLDEACKLHPSEASEIRVRLVGDKRLIMREEGKSKLYSVPEGGPK